MCHFVFVLRGKAGEFQRDVLLTFVFQRGSITATWRAHRRPVGASCEFLWVSWEAGELQQDVISIFIFLRGAVSGHMQGSQESNWGIL